MKQKTKQKMFLGHFFSGQRFSESQIFNSWKKKMKKRKGRKKKILLA